MKLTKVAETVEFQGGGDRSSATRIGAFVLRVGIGAMLALSLFYISLLATSEPIEGHEMAAISSAIERLESRGFRRESILLRQFATYRSSDNWLNRFVPKENAFAATNCPFGVITIYRDFFDKTADDAERAMILLHEARHLTGASEREAYAYVWQNRSRLGWTQLSHGTTPTFVTIELQTRENAPELFDCAANQWSDCTEVLRAGRQF